MQPGNKIDPSNSGGDWSGYGEVSGPFLLQLLQQDKLRVVFAGNAILVWIQRPDGVAGIYRLVDTQVQPPALQELTSELDHLFTMAELLPLWQSYGQKAGFDYRVVAGICYQESGFKNWKVHLDGTGFGLYGLDDNGLLPDFERWSGLSVGRGSDHQPVSPNKQTEFACIQLRRYQDQLGSAILAAQAWHRGLGNYSDDLGVHYGGLIRAHVQSLFNASL